VRIFSLQNRPLAIIINTEFKILNTVLKELFGSVSISTLFSGEVRLFFG